jgi:hypothetical protein
MGAETAGQQTNGKARGFRRFRRSSIEDVPTAGGGQKEKGDNGGGERSRGRRPRLTSRRVRLLARTLASMGRSHLRRSPRISSLASSTSVATVSSMAGNFLQGVRDRMMALDRSVVSVDAPPSPVCLGSRLIQRTERITIVLEGLNCSHLTTAPEWQDGRSPSLPEVAQASAVD